ncbi:MAG: hypothetical protein RTV31_11220 [Candidatus Thorarchaeota archaeon]
MQKKRMIVYFALLIIGIVIPSTIMTGVSNRSIISDISDISVPRSTIPDSCVYPATYDIEYNTSYLFRGNYASQINVSKETAVDVAFTFLSVYLPEELLTGLRIGAEHWPGSPSLSNDFWPTWMMTLVSDYIRAAVFVNALSGKVVQFYMSGYDTSDFDFESIESTEEAENHTIDFLRLQNYTLLPDAVYDGASPPSGVNNPSYYTLSFHQVVDEIPVSFGWISFHVDATYGLVIYFDYRWIEIDEIPVDRVLPVEEINDIVLEADNDLFSLSGILSTDLCFNRKWFGPDSREFEMRLVYEVRVVRGVNPDVYTVDAISGEILGIGHEIGVTFALYEPYVGVAAMLMVAAVSSWSAYKFVKKKQLYALLDQYQDIP